MISDTFQGEGWPQLLLKISKAASEMSRASGGHVDYEAVKRAVVRTQPPRAEDVPDMTEFVRKWGGGDSGFFVKELNDFCKVFDVPLERNISSSVFKTLAVMDFGIHGMPAHAVNAVIKAIAACPKSKTYDGYARWLTSSEINSLSRPTHIAAFTKANDIMIKARRLANENGSMSDHKKQKEISQLDIECINFILKKSDNYSSLEEICSSFAKTVVGIDTVDDAPPTKQESAPNFVQYNEAGESVGVGRMTVLNNGFDINDIVVKKKGAKNEQFLIKNIFMDGDSLLVPVAADGTVPAKGGIQVPPGELLMMHKNLKSNKVELLEGYPQNEAKNSDEYRANSLKAQVAVALETLTRATPLQPVRVQSKPTRSVFSTRTVEVGDLLLVPSSFQIGCGEKVSARGIACSIGEEDMKLAIEPAVVNVKFAPAFWLVRSSSDKKEVNMELQPKKVMFVPPSIDKKPSVKEAVEIQIPCMVNTKQLQNDTELVMYKKPDKSAQSKRLSLAVEPRKSAAKKQRT